jgi:hypothetical protein
LSSWDTLLSEHGIGVAEGKVTAIRETRPTQTVSEVKSFMGLVNFTGRFIPNLATLGEPLNRLMKKEQLFMWGKEQEAVFVKLKEVLANSSTLAYFDVNAKTQVIADATPVGFGAVLVQKQGEDYTIICYASGSLSDIERRYSQTNKEALVIDWACERFHVFCSVKHSSYLQTINRLSLYFQRNPSLVPELNDGYYECSRITT